MALKVFGEPEREFRRLADDDEVESVGSMGSVVDVLLPLLSRSVTDLVLSFCQSPLGVV